MSVRSLRFRRDVALDEARVDLAGQKIGMGQNALQQRQRRLDRFDDEFPKASLHTADGLFARRLVYDDLGEK